MECLCIRIFGGETLRCLQEVYNWVWNSSERDIPNPEGFALGITTWGFLEIRDVIMKVIYFINIDYDRKLSLPYAFVNYFYNY